MALFLFFVLVAVVLGVIGVVGHNLTYLLIIGIVVFVLDVFVYGARIGRRARTPSR